MKQSSRTRVEFARTILLVLALTTPGFAQEERAEECCEVSEALAGGRTWARLRYRAESVEQDPFTQDAFASTLRTVLGYETADFHGFKALIEFEDVAPIGNDINYNSTTNGAVNRPVVADPDGTEVNQIYVSYKLNEDTSASVGRRALVIGNARFVGDVAWRQNYQTYDGVVLSHNGIPNTRINYALVNGINRVNGENHPLGRERTRSHVLDIRHDLEGVGELAAYAILLDLDVSKTANTDTYGVRLAGSQELNDDLDILYTAEYADQSDGDGNPGAIDANYHLGELGVAFAGVTLKVGQELLGNSGSAAAGFSTPLATLHKFNGFADKFLATPAAGLEDNFVSVSTKIGKAKCSVVYHEFNADTGSMDYGGELNFNATMPLTKRLTLGVRYANFNRDGSAPVGFQDTEKVMGWLAYSLL